MKRIITSIAAIIALSLPAIASASSWKIDADHSNMGFKVRHLMVSNVKGSFEKVAGVLELDDKDITKSKVDVTIETASINTNAAKRDEHLRSADFFDVAKYPTMTFVSKKVAKAGKNLKVTGNLTLHGVTRPVVLTVDPITKESKDPWGNLRRGTTATTTINRKDFGLVWNAGLETGGVAVGEEVAIILEIELIKK
ncbi:YceI family protein [Geotalea toluenoxydans]|uniref:YceI family protein n=1 Tax=Geotalea toluenoxydans TaxID=421624 RepID=UPI0006D03CCB|nr:YceI family protein [Geotalea toluenoxydans]